MNVKAAGIALIMFTSAFLGFKISGKIAVREKRLSILQLMTDRIYSLIEHTSLHTGEILSVIASESSFENLLFLKEAEKMMLSGMSFNDAWKKAVYDDYTIGESEKEILQLMGVSLGRSGRKGQLSMLKLHSESIKKLRDLLAPELRNKRKLYSSLGVLTGIFLSLMMI